MSEFDEAVIQRIKQLEREVERLQKWERAADLGLGKLSDPNADRVLFWDDSAGALKWLTVDGIVGTDLGKWQSYTVSWTAESTNPAIGNGTLAGRYVQIGKTVICSIALIMGSTTTYGSGNWKFSLPVTAKSSGLSYLGKWVIVDAGTTYYEGNLILYGASANVDFFIRNQNAVDKFNNTTPINWAANDQLMISIVYEVA